MVAEIVSREELLQNPKRTEEFLRRNFMIEKRSDGCLTLDRINPYYARGSATDDGGIIPHGVLLDAIMCYHDITPTRIEIGGFSEGLTIYSGLQPVFNIEDAFVAGNEKRPSDYKEAAQCAYFITTNIVRGRVPKLDLILQKKTKHVTATRANQSVWEVGISS